MAKSYLALQVAGVREYSVWATASVGGHCSRSALNRHDVGTCAQPVKVVAPILHHIATLIDSLCAVVGIPNFVAFRVRELESDQLGMPSFFVQ
jgi:hypothetical protein